MIRNIPVGAIHESQPPCAVAMLTLVCGAAENHLAAGRENYERMARIESEDFARLEGEGGRGTPPADLVDVPLANAILRRPRRAAGQTGSRRK
jgi:hypothetical protein